MHTILVDLHKADDIDTHNITQFFIITLRLFFTGSLVEACTK